MRDAAVFSSQLLNESFVPEMEKVLEESLNCSHALLSRRVANAIKNPSSVKSKLKQDDVESIAMPSVTSGTQRCLATVTDVPNNDNVSSDIIECAVAPSCRYYAAPIARSYFINATKAQKDTYSLVVELAEHLASLLVPGAVVSSVYESGLKFVKEKDPMLVPFCPKEFGFSCGLSPYDPCFPIGPGNSAKVREGMTFLLTLGVRDYVKKAEEDPKESHVSFFIADTVVVKEGGAVELTTTSKLFKKVSYNLREENDEEVVREEAKDLDKSAIQESRLRDRTTSAVDDRDKHQELLGKRLNADLLNRAAGNVAASKVQPEAEKGPAYKSVATYPREVQPNQLYIDSAKEVLFCPIYGVLVPFKISSIKNVTKNENSLRINFNQPQGSEQPRNGDAEFTSSIGELVYLIPSTIVCTQLEVKLKEIIKRIRIRNTVRTQDDELFTEEPLRIERGRNPRLNDVLVNPPLAGRRCPGSIEAHSNGFRFMSNKGQKLDIIYKNIRFAFFQKSEKELIVLIHFRLKKPIIVGKKKTVDVQFFTEIAEFSTDINSRTTQYEEEEIEQEQRARERKKRLNEEFDNFCKMVQETTTVTFDRPYRDLGFFGVPERSCVELYPTTSCIVSLTEPPFFILPVQDIDLVVFERVGQRMALKNFDLIIIFKDYSKSVQPITNIPMEYLEHLHDWFDTLDIKYYDLPRTMKWKPLLEHIMKIGNKRFVEEEGGWSILDISDSEESENEEEAGSDFEPDPEDNDDDDDDELSDYDDDESSSVDEEESDDDGEDWSDLEKEATRADKSKNFD